MTGVEVAASCGDRPLLPTARQPEAAWSPLTRAAAETSLRVVTTYGTGSRTTTFARLVMRAARVLSKHLWAVPLLGALVFGLVGLWVRSRVEETTRAEIAARLQTVLHANI